MMTLKKMCKALLFPPMAVMIPLIPVATVFLVYAMAVLGTESPFAIASYVLAAYTLTVWCVKIPRLVSAVKGFKKKNRYAKKWFEDTRFRVSAVLWGSFLWNAAYAAFQLGLGICHASFWYYSTAAYYLFLASMRLFLARHTRRHAPGERMCTELVRYRACGWVFLAMNLALTAMIVCMIHFNRTFEHHEITTIAMATYTFTAFTVAIVNLVRYRKYHSPVYSASKAISLAAACVSMLTLTSTMLTTFDDGTAGGSFRTLMLSMIGGAVSVFIVVLALYMIVQSTKKLHLLQAGEPQRSIHTHEES